MERYPHDSIEEKWRGRWEAGKTHHTDLARSQRKKYVLVMFSYPSGDKLHIGHWYNFAPTDTYARFLKLRGFNVFEPMGFDAFGLPAENYAIKTGIHPHVSTQANIAFIREQLKTIGAMYDWPREVDTSSPEYYRWTQWVFLKLHEKGLVYRRKSPVNWCPSCNTVLANDQVQEGRCWRCESQVDRRNLEQWFVRITEYAERLLAGLDGLDWPEETRTIQRNWIGKSQGAEIRFPLEDGAEPVVVFTTRPDTLFGATYLVLAPEHPLVDTVTAAGQREAVTRYVREAARASDTERTFANRPKTGVSTGATARHPLTGERLPIWIADYVLPGYGTGAIMAVPAHDERDFEFARAHGLPIRTVIEPPGGPAPEPYSGPGRMTRSGEFDGLDGEAGGQAVAARLGALGLGRAAVSYRMRDWCVSRQRYWGAPIPMVHCSRCGWRRVPEAELPIRLPENVDFRPLGTGESPLATDPGFAATTCPSCGTPARRETDTMDTFVDSSWYFLRYPSADRSDVPFETDVVNSWMPVDMYVGGPEHSRGHLIFARFVNMVLHDLGYVAVEEPFRALRHQGIITHKGQRMSKGKGNVVVPDDYVREHGADTFRMYLMFMGSYELGGEWSDQGLHGMSRFVNRIWRMVNAIAGGRAEEEAEDGTEDRRPADEAARDLQHRLHVTIDAVTRDLERMSFNTAISRLMELASEMGSYRRRPAGQHDPALLRDVALPFVQLLSPFAPHLGAELWERMGGQGDVFASGWPQADPAWLTLGRITVVVQVDGKLRARIQASPEAGEELLREAALGDERVREFLVGRVVKRVVVVPSKLVNIVTAP